MTAFTDKHQWRISQGTRLPPPPGGHNFFIFMQFSAKIDKFIGWHRPPPGSWRPLLGEILDPPLNTLRIEMQNKGAQQLAQTMTSPIQMHSHGNSEQTTVLSFKPINENV